MRMHFNPFRIMQVRVENFDLCISCENMEICPLINALRDDLAVIRHKSIRIDDCCLYKKEKRA